MQIYRLEDGFKNTDPIAIALGNYDGLHRGHIELIRTVIRDAKELGLSSSVILFTEHTNEVLRGSVQEYLTSLEDKLEILSRLPIDKVFITAFDEAMRSLSADEFLSGILIDTLCAEHIVVGKDYRFGSGALGTVEHLIDKSKSMNYTLDVIDDLKVDQERISSSRIKKFIKAGRVQEANELLGYEYKLNGIVVPGAQRGRKLGYPTANLKMDFPYVIPRDGLYFTRTRVLDADYFGLTCIGNNPTFDNQTNTIETFLADFDEMIYGHRIVNHFISRIRSNYKFDSLEDLIAQMNSDETVMNRRIEVYTKDNR